LVLKGSGLAKDTERMWEDKKTDTSFTERFSWGTTSLQKNPRRLGNPRQYERDRNLTFLYRPQGFGKEAANLQEG